MRIFKLWIITGIIFGIGEITRVWHTHQSSEGSNGFFQLRFWEALLAGNFQKIVVLNLGLNLLFILGKWMQMLFLGRLRELESYKSGDRIRDYVLMKTVFIGAIVGSGGGEDDEKEILIWFVWLTAVGFLKHFGLLCRDRLEYMTLSINSSISAYSRVMALLCLVFIGNLVLVQLCLSTFGCWSNCPPGGLSALALLLFECVVVGIDCGQTMVRFLVHFVNEARAGRWEHRGFYLFSSELLCELLVHSLTLLHLLHVWFLHGLSLSLTDALLFIHTRTVMHSIHGKIGALRTYVTMDRRFRDASKEELVSNDDHCSICHEPMSSAKVLPCGHMFHLVCLRGWLEHSPTCPICRRPVQPADTQASGTGAGADAAQEVDADMQNAARQMLQDLMQGEEADRRAHGENGGVALLQEEPMIRRQSWTIGWGGGGNGWMSWLPRFSIEVVRQHVTRDEGGGRRFFAVDVGAGQGIDQGNVAEGISTHHHEEALDAAVAQVLGVLPDLCPHAVREDLMLTGDIQVTLERGLEGQIQFRSEPSPAEAEPVVTEALPSEQIQFRSEPSPAEAESMATDASSAEPGPSRGDAQETAFPSAAVDSLAIGDGDSGQGDGTAVSETAGFRDSRGGCEVTAHTDRLDGHATCTVKCPENADGVHPHRDEDERLEASIREAISSGAEAGMAGAAAGGDTCDRAFDSAT